MFDKTTDELQAWINLVARVTVESLTRERTCKRCRKPVFWHSVPGMWAHGCGVVDCALPYPSQAEPGN